MTNDPSKKTFKPQDEHFDNFIELCAAIKERYTLGFRDACQLLKVSRTWMNTYIRPTVPVVYLSRGIGNNPGPNYHYIAFKIIGIDPPKDQIFFDKKAFESYVFSHIVSCQKRAKRISKSMLMSDAQKKSYFFEFEKKSIAEKQAEKDFLSGQISATELTKAFKDRVDCWKNHVPENVLKELQFVNPTKRTEAPFVNVPIPKTPIDRWVAVHDIMEYGDTSETIYRSFFSEGMIRVELNFENPKNETKAKKVYYIADPDEDAILQINREFAEIITVIEKKTSREIDSEIKVNLITDDFITVSEESWQIFNKKYNVL